MTIPHLLTEDIVPPYTGCTFVTAVMMASYGGIHLPLGITTAEHYALVKQAGKTVGNEGATLDDIQRGYQHRYGVTAHLFKGSIVQLYALGDVYCLVQGMYSDLPAHFRRWDTGFGGIHAAGYIPKLNWWQDPLATQRAITAGFNGEVITLPQIGAYALGFGGMVHALYVKAGEFAPQAGPAQPTGGSMSVVHLKPGAPPVILSVKPDPRIRWMDVATGQLRGPFKSGNPYGWAGTIEPAFPPDPSQADRSTGYQCEINGRVSFFLASNVIASPIASAGGPKPAPVVSVSVTLSDGSSVVLKA